MKIKYNVQFRNKRIFAYQQKQCLSKDINIDLSLYLSLNKFYLKSFKTQSSIYHLDKRCGPEKTWHTLHEYAYIGVLDLSNMTLQCISGGARSPTQELPRALAPLSTSWSRAPTKKTYLVGIWLIQKQLRLSLL